ncbi:MAG: phosphomannomutase/phosphoglucomutase [Nitrospinota bacterium]|nr:phosphomannomutase/phosphoglucomutase [Nitrospinota bacterium]MDH5678507.1 phosphomannomutase/phosphoglucomutase [Nitrospinota bacterium]MDH5755239.1 phosphomannomutase/phosphoglucomutase [Nitrospinota bacterium]
MNRSIFREYDIRGIVKKDLTSQVVENIGRAFGTIIARKGGKSVTVGNDARKSCGRLLKNLTDGITSTGVDVIQIGLVPTPLLYFSLVKLKPAGGVMITGSHNPPEFNGFKLCVGAMSIHGEQIQKMADMIEAKDFATGNGQVSQVSVTEDYIKMVKQKIKLDRKLKIVIDAGNGCGGLFAPRLMRELGCEVVELFCKVDGSFPNHHPDPTVPANLTDLIAKVKEEKADAGFAYDGDADRIGVVDEKGGILFGDQLMMIYARDILKRKPGAAIVYDVKCTQNLELDIKKHKGRPLINATGHSLIKARLKKEKAELAGEMSAHIFFKEGYYGYDDAIFATARFLRIMAGEKGKVSQYLAGLPKLFNTPEIRVDCPDDVKFELIKDITEHFKKTHKVVDIDGARIDFGDGWGLIRASNTQPVLVLRFEANSKAALNKIKKVIYKKLATYPSQTGMAMF